MTMTVTRMTMTVTIMTMLNNLLSILWFGQAKGCTGPWRIPRKAEFLQSQVSREAARRHVQNCNLHLSCTCRQRRTCIRACSSWYPTNCLGHPKKRKINNKQQKQLTTTNKKWKITLHKPMYPAVDPRKPCDWPCWKRLDLFPWQEVCLNNLVLEKWK